MSDTGWQGFDATTRPEDGPPRLARLREEMARRDLRGWLVPRADVHQGEYVTERDARLAWLTGFTGSAGFAIITRDRAGVFIDGRYRSQVKVQTDSAAFTPVPWPETRPALWLREALPGGGRVGFDPWLHTRREIAALTEGLAGSGIGLHALETNLVDVVRGPVTAPPVVPARVHPVELSGASAAERRAGIAEALRLEGQAATVLTLADSVAWITNLRGADLPKNPVLHGFAIVEADGRLALFTDPAKITPEVHAALGNEVVVLPESALLTGLEALTGPVRLDPASAPEAIFRLFASLKVPVVEAPDPTALPKARKTAAELEGMRQAHRRDAVAMARILHWIDSQPADSFDEIAVVQVLEGFRREAGAYDLSFDTICGIGANAALPHYRVSRDTNTSARPGALLLLDSGGQYPEGTTDITRTVILGGQATPEQRECYTRVLRGMIAIARTPFPRGLAGRDLDALARAPLWRAGLDYDHGTGHGVGAALCVHEGPQRISRVSEVPLEPGMILSDEPGYYREGDFGIRLEILLALRERDPAASPDGRAMLEWEVLTWAPLDRRLIAPDMLDSADRAWIDAYHAEVWHRISPELSPEVRDWLRAATAPLG